MSKKFEKDAMGTRMKENYENRTRYYVPRRVPVIIRIDGRAFHSYVKKIKAKKPYDLEFMDRMNQTALYLCSEIQGSNFAYVASDEITIVITDFDDVNTEMWFDGNIQKMASVSASIATAFFNSYKNNNQNILATFDSRVFVIPDRVEVYNNIYWRYKDWLRNSVSMLARNSFSHKELQGKKISDMHEMLHSKDVNWAKENDAFKNGRIIFRKDGKFIVETCPELPKNKKFIENLIPTYGY